MGIDFSHAEAHWSYSGFNRFRTRVAEAIGFDLDVMDGFKEGGQPWSTMKDDVKPLLNHSDCDGELTVKEMKKVGPRLKEIVSAWDKDDFDRAQGLLLAEGMESAVAAGEAMEFR